MTREEAIKVLRDTPIDIRSTREDDIHTLYATAQGMAIDALQAKPAKHGKWINKQKPNINYIPPYNCSECGGAGYGTDYCPNCGAKMDGKK